MSKKTEESQIITLQDVNTIADSLYSRLEDPEKENLLRLLITQQITKRIVDLDKKGKTIEATIEEFAQDIERRLLNKLVWQEVKAKILK